jgi:hypothetical protein
VQKTYERAQIKMECLGIGEAIYEQDYIIVYYIHDKITAIWLVKRSAIISLIALSRSAINDFCDGWGEREIKTTKSNMAAKFR